MLLTLRYALQSQVGLRANNEDAAFAGPRLLALADGMGGHAAGELASSLAIDQLLALHDSEPSRDLLRDLRVAVDRANTAIAERSAAEPDVAGMGTTLTTILFAGDRIALAHVGDSRAYLLRQNTLMQITRDDTLVQSLIAQGRLTREEAAQHPQRSMVLRVLTGQPVDPFFEIREVAPGDRYLICSDGLSDYVPEQAIARALDISDLQSCPQQLIRLALRQGSRDNITCIVGEVAEGHSGYNIAMTTGASGKSATLAGI